MQRLRQSPIRPTVVAPAVVAPSQPAPASASAATVALPWLVRLRWHAVIGQAIAVGVAAWLGARLPVGALLASVALLALSNAVVASRACRISETGVVGLGAVLLFDALQLTLQLGLAGGATNPFAVLYLVEVLIAVLALRARWIAAVAGTSVVGFSVLFFESRPIEGLSRRAELAGTWVALVLAVAIAAYLGGRIAATLRDQTMALTRSLRLAARAEKLASLSALAAGAAHELGTPLGTIAVASSELESLIESAPAEAIEEARVVRDEVDRCRAILDRMIGRAGTMVGELPEEISAAAVLAMARYQLPAGDRQRVRVEGDIERTVRCPVQSLAQVLAGLVANGLHASADGPVVVRVRADRRVLRFEVRDEGSGIPSEVLSRVGEPFFTTKPPGKGMGLGLFLAQSFAELCSGELEIGPAEPRGTRVALALPLFVGMER
jgi:two-component system sensor histidine kinase RegB